MTQKGKDRRRLKKPVRIGLVITAMVMALFVGTGLVNRSITPVYAAEKTSDGNTTGSYAQNLGDNSSTRYAGRVWTDKTVYTEDATFSGDVGNVTVKNDSDFLVAYSALATTQNITGKSSVPVDVVFVIDNSNSMDNDLTWQQTRLEATVAAVNTSIAKVMESHPDSRVAVVVYGSSAHTLLPLGHYDPMPSGNYIAVDGNFTGNNSSYTEFSASESHTLLMQGANRGTNIHMGVDAGLDILKSATDIGEGATKHVPALILLSDGAATYSGGNNSNWWDPSGAAGTGSDTNNAHALKVAMNAQYNKQQVNEHYGIEDPESSTACKIYTIGMGIEQLRETGWGANNNDYHRAQMALDPGTHLTDNNDVANAIEDAWDWYINGKRVQTGGWPWDPTYETTYTPELDNYTFEHPRTGDISTIAYNDGYYSAENAEDVSNVFDDITSEIVSASAQAPTHIEGDPLESGYLTYTDPIGEYMEVKDIKSIIYGGEQFTQKSSSTDGNTTTYTFEGATIESPVYGELDVSSIEISVTKDDNGNETLTVKIPAAAIPLRVNTVDIDENGAVTNTNNNAYPARILYTVGVRDGVDLDTLQGVSDDYISSHLTEDGQKVNFYSNKYSGNTQNNKTVGDAKVTFTAAETNPFFYVQEDTPLYRSPDIDKPAYYTVNNDDTLYYFQITYYEGNSEKTEWVSRPGSSFWYDGTTDATLKVLDDGQVAIKQGAPRLGYLDDFAETKTENTTNTAEQVFHPVYDGNGQFTIYLGNNGVLQADAPKSLTVEKDVAAGVGLTAPDADFTFEVTVASKADTTGDAILTDADGQTTDKELTFDADGKATFTLKDGQSMEILNIGEGVNYTVKEINLPAGFTSDQADNTKTGTVSGTDEANVVTFKNTYNVTPVTTVDLGITLGGTKSITGRDFQADDEFVFTIAAAQATPNAPLPTEDIDQDGSATTATVNPTSGNEFSFEFGDITFTKPGEYRYVIRETLGTLPGVDYDRALYRVNIIVKDNGDGTMSLASVDGGLTGAGNVNYPTNPFIQIWDGDQAGAVVDAVAFENNYSATDAKATIQGMKVLNSTNNDRILADDDFTFTVEALGYNTDGGDQFNQVPAGDPEQPMPANTEVKNVANGNVIFGEMTFTQDMIGNTYGYKITEKLPQGVDENNPTLNGITYDTSEKIVKVTVTRSDEGGEEHVVATVTPNDGTAEAAKNFTFTNTYEPSSVTIGDDTDDAITVQKTFTGRTWNDSDEFEYTLRAIDNAPMPASAELTIGKPASGNSNTATFGDIEFVKEGVYEYEISETNGGLGGVTYDKHTAKVTVTVTEDTATGTLSAKVEYDNSAAENNSDKAVQDAAAFTNAYKAVFDADTTVNLNGTKELTGKTLTDNAFYFIVDPQETASGGHAPTGDSAALNPNKADGSIQLLKNITYTEAGDYVYIIREQIPSNKALGMTYDESEYRVTVTVTDDQQGNLTASEPKIEKKAAGAVNYVEADAVVFENNYEPLSITIAPLQITKVLDGDRNTPLQDGEFSFEMSVVSADPEDGITLPQQTVVENKADGTVPFGDITFTKVGTYKVQVKEVVPDEADKVPGVEYDTHVRTTTFTVTDNAGQLAVQRSGYDGDRTFTNKYTTTGTLEGATNLEVTKNFTGRENDQWLDTDEFTFTLTAGDEKTANAITAGTVKLPGNAGELKISADTADHKAAFGDITFNAPGDYSFKITETKGSLPGVTYDGHEATFTVTATDNGDGTLDISTDLNKDNLTFTNTYDGEDLVLTGDTALKVKKELTIPEGSQQAVSLQAGDYQFEVTSEALDGSDADGVVLPENTTVSNDENGDVVFDGIKFTKVGTYKLTVKEVVPADDQKKPGVTYDTHAYSVTYKVENDYDNGKLVLAEGYPKVEDGATATFNNVYGAEGKLEGSTNLAITKVIEGRDWNDNDSFTFNLTADEDYGEAVMMGTSAVTITKDTADHKASFGDITFTQTGTYNFTIKEADPQIDKMTYDDHEVKVSVKVEDKDGNGTLTVSPTITGEMTFTNTHNPDNATASIEGTKIFTGREIKDSDSFTFDIAVADNSAEGTPSPATSSVTVSGKDFTEGKAAVDFGTFSFNKVGTYVYTITEQTGTIGGVTYDNGTVTATVNVTYDNAAGVFSTAVTYSKEGGVNPGNAFEFTNVYKALPTDPVTGVFSATKTVTPSEGNSYDMEGGEFEFTLTPSTSNPTADPVKATTVSNDATGAVTFVNDVIYTEPGKYVYTIQETANSVGGITYDGSIYTVTIDVTDDGSGKLTAETSITKDGTEADAIVFDNSYDPAETGLSIGGTKELTGKDLEADMFSFTLIGIDGAPMPVDGQTTVTAKNTAGGAFDFGQIKYDQVGEYKYEVSEVNDDATGVTYDTNTYNVTVTVTDEGGVLKAVPSVENSQIVFKNSYAPIPLVLEGDAAIGGTKNLTGRPMNAEEFVFELKDGENVIAEATNNADGSFSFSGIKIDKVGQYHYTVSEKNTGKGGVTYDNTIWNVTVDAYDENGYIKADVTYSASGSDSDAIVFNNTYAAEGTSVTLGAVKVLEGRDITDGEFTFRLEDADGNLISEVKNDVNGKVTFDSIAYETPGTFEYVVYEVPGSEENMTYDENRHQVTVTVEDNQNGHLVANITGDKNLVFTNTYTEPEKPVEPSGPATGVWTNPAPFAVTFTASLAAILAILYRRLH